MRAFTTIGLCIVMTSCMNLVGPTKSVKLSAGSIRDIDGVTPYVVYVPTTYNVSTALPALLLIHGAGGTGPDFIMNWTDFAESHGIILVAPTLDLSAEAEVRAPILLRAIMNAVRAQWTVDSSRIYVFGYSGGGYFAYDAALLDADYFAAGGIFASVIQPGYDNIVQQAPRHTAIAIYIGDHDQYFSLAEARRTRDLLLAAGDDVHYEELGGVDHNYSAVAGKVNPDAWQFMSAHTLPGN